MVLNTINLTVRFILELVCLFSIGYWASGLSEGIISYVLALSLPLIAATIWGVFAVPGDPSRSGNAPISVPGFVRLFIEFAFFTAAVYSLYETQHSIAALVLALIVLLHYCISYERVIWLLKR